MRKFFGLGVMFAAFAAVLTSYGAHALPGTSPGGPASIAAGTLVQPAKLRCGVNEDGDFVCTTKPKNNDGGNGGGGGGNKCAGKNNCGSGYRDLDSPNKYGACCEQIPTNSCNQGCKNHCTNSFVPGSQKWKSCVAGCGC